MNEYQATELSLWTTNKKYFIPMFLWTFCAFHAEAFLNFFSFGRWVKGWERNYKVTIAIKDVLNRNAGNVFHFILENISTCCICSIYVVDLRVMAFMSKRANFKLIWQVIFLYMHVYIMKIMYSSCSAWT